MLLVMHGFQMIGWKLDQIGMSPSAESYLVLHRFGPVRAASSLVTPSFTLSPETEACVCSLEH